MADITIATPPCYRIIGTRAGIILDWDEPRLSPERIGRLHSYIDQPVVDVRRIDGDLMVDGFSDPGQIYATPDGAAWWMVRSGVAAQTVAHPMVDRICATVDLSGDTGGQQQTPLLGVDSANRLVASLMPLWPTDITEPIAYLPARRFEIHKWIRTQAEAQR